MRNIKIKDNKLSRTALIFALMLSFVFPFFEESSADTSTMSYNEKQKAIDELNEKIKVYSKIIELKNKQQESLNNQIEIMDAEIGKLEAEIDLKKEEIQGLNGKIAKLEEGIDEQQESMDLQKEILTNLIQEYAVIRQQDTVYLIISNKSISDFLNKSDRITQMGAKAKEIYDNIRSIKANLENEKKSLEENKKTVIGKYTELQGKSAEVQNNIDQKKELISQTEGEESKYQKLLDRVEEQKQELLNIDELGANLSADAYAKPPSNYFASNDWYYSQRDSRWGNQKIGNSKSLMKSYGCAVTAVAMVFDYYGANITPGALAKKPIFSWDLISWPSSWSSPSLTLISGIAHGNISWSKIDSEIKKGNPVIVYIKKSKGSGGHYVVIHHKTSTGKYVVHDPYWGANIYLDTSRALVGKLSPESSTVVDQMIIYKK